MKSNKLSSPIDLIIQSLSLYKNHAPALIGYSAWLLFPFVIYIALDFFPRTLPVIIVSFFVSIAELFLTVWISIILMRIITAYDNKKLVDQNAVQNSSLLLIRPVLLVAILYLLIIIGGLILLVIPGIIFLFWYSFAQAAVILDNKQGMDALRFSKSLVAGRFWKVSYRAFVGPFILGFVYSLIIGVVLMILASGAGLDTAEIFSGKLPIWVQITERLGEVFVFPLFIAYVALLYKDTKRTMLLAVVK